MTIHIRTATYADIATIATLVLALLDELSGDEPSGYSLRDLSDRTSRLMSAGDVSAIIAERSREAVGVVVLNSCASLYAGRFGEITELYVKPALRSSGAGAALLSAACEYGRERFWSRLEVGTPEQPAWVRTLEFYRRHHFIETGVRLKLPL
ncbi:GNAT family N-acetyltransferase [Peristeroidobacter agariperforans]|uniref:GNAT family N-acetyltransferase n=1 Tax=Peristeroidobacter agariperforans TaxID=268404 RepID=UPI00101E1A43|nr:GNAT family N-acetyltransferase [Peristeroidobacter agariperforans]